MVIAFSEEQHLKNIEEFGIKKYNEMLKMKMEQYGKVVEDKIGIKFVSVNIHNDEGSYEKGLHYNFHAHMNFLDFDFKNEKMVMRNIRPHTKKSKIIFSELQTELANIFSDLGFERGKENSTAKHLSPEQYKEAQDKIENEIEEVEIEIENMTLEELTDMKIKYKDNKLLKRIIDYAFRIKKLENQENEFDKKKKTYDNFISTYEKIKNGEETTKEENQDIIKILKVVAPTSKALKSVSQKNSSKVNPSS